MLCPYHIQFLYLTAIGSFGRNKVDSNKLFCLLQMIIVVLCVWMKDKTNYYDFFFCHKEKTNYSLTRVDMNVFCFFFSFSLHSSVHLVTHFIWIVVKTFYSTTIVCLPAFAQKVPFENQFFIRFGEISQKIKSIKIEINT